MSEEIFKFDGPQYLINIVECSQKCPNNKDFDQNIQFAQFCTKCYNEISKKHKPVLKPRKLILPKNSDNLLFIEKCPNSPHHQYNETQDDAHLNLYSYPKGDSTNSPICKKKLNRERCHICQKRLPLFCQKKNENDKFYCTEHNKSL